MRSSICPRTPVVPDSRWRYQLALGRNTRSRNGGVPITQDLLQEWIHIHSCQPNWVVQIWPSSPHHHGVKTTSTSRATPWPNRAETAVRLFKRQYVSKDGLGDKADPLIFWGFFGRVKV